jgi:hypothetical protein
MENDEKKYISPLGVDFTEFIKTEENKKDFEKLCEHEEKCKGVSLKDSFKDVVEALNLEAKLKGKPKRAFIQAGPGMN